MVTFFSNELHKGVRFKMLPIDLIGYLLVTDVKMQLLYFVEKPDQNLLV